MNVKGWLVAVVLGAVGASWAIGRVLHLLGARHSGAQILAEVVVLGVIGAVFVGRRVA